MSRRARAIGFAIAALVCAGLAASIAGGYRTKAADQFGPLTPVLVARADLPAEEPLDRAAMRLLTVRRIPVDFVPPGALTTPAEALGRAPAARIPAGSYLLGAQLVEPHRGDRAAERPGALAPGREPVEIEVTGARALAASGRDPAGGRVDVVVTTEPGPGGSGRTYVAAEGVTLLALAESATGDGLPGPLTETWTATLALTRPQALRLIGAQNFAREVRLIGNG